MDDFDFAKVTNHFDSESFSLMQHKEDQRQAEKIFIDKLTRMLDDYLRKNRDPTETNEPEMTTDDVT